MDKYDIFIEAGQSNAEGSGYGPVTEEFEKDPRILYLTAANTVTTTESGLDIQYHNVPFSIDIADERDWSVKGEPVRLGDLSLTFAKAYIDAGLLEKDRKILIIRAAIGGTGFMKHHWGMGDILCLKMLELTDYALSLNPENRIKGLLWHQGEHDALEGNTPERYHMQLSALINSVKKRYDCPNLPFICGGFVQEWLAKNQEMCSPILQVLRQVAQEQHGMYVETDDLLSNNEKTGSGDDVHFCRESLHILGNRYFQSYLKIMENK